MPTKEELMRIIEELLRRKPLNSKLSPAFQASYKTSLVNLLSRRIGVSLIEQMNDVDAERYLALVADNNRTHAMELLQKAVPNSDAIVEREVESFLADISYGRA